MSRTESAEIELVGLAVEASQPSGAAVGIVDDATDGAASALMGMRVLVGPTDPCGQCEVCRRGGAAVCAQATPRGPVGKRLRVPTRWVVALQAGLDLPVPAAAAVAGDVTTAYTLYARTGLGPREPVVVLGATAVTRFLVEILRGKGITPTVVVDGPNDDVAWRSWLLEKGAAVVSGSGDVLVASIGGAVSAQGMGNRPWRVIATEPAVVAQSAELAGARSTLTVLADRDIPSLPGQLLAREVTVIGVRGPHPDLIVEAAALCVKGEIDLASGVGDGPTQARVVPA